MFAFVTSWATQLLIARSVVRPDTTDVMNCYATLKRYIALVSLAHLGLARQMDGPTWMYRV
jgi:hypothetical protein